MASKLPVRKIDEADVPDLPDESGRQLLEPLNRDLDVLYVALDGGLTLSNLRCIVKTVQVTGPDEWVPLTLGANWAAGTTPDAPPPAYRYANGGMSVEMRGTVRWTGGGSPPAGSVIATGLPRPTYRDRHAVDATNAYGRIDTTTAGQLLYVAGTATDIALRGVRFEPAVPTLPAWQRPLDVILGDVNRVAVGPPDAVWVIGVEREDKAPPAPVSIDGWTLGPVSDDKRRTIRFRRINGLAQGVKYRLTFLFLLPD